MELDDMMHWRTNFANEELEKLKEVPSIRVHLPDDVVLSLDISDEMKCDIAVATQGPGDSFVFDFPPPKCSQMLVIALEPKSNSVGNWLMAGNTWPFKDGFDALNIPFQYQTDVKGSTSVVRLITNVDFSKTEDAQKQLQSILDTVEESPVVLRLQQSGYSPDLFLQVMNVAESLSFVRLEK